MTVLIGPNNQGKSNLLRAAVLAMEFIEGWATFPHSRNSKPYEVPLRMVIRSSLYSRLNTSSSDLVEYDWEVDYPIFAKDRNGTRKTTAIGLEFELDAAEQEEFKKHTGIATNHRLPVRIAINRNNRATLSIPKQGKGSHIEKSREIASFISSRIALLHIPAVRPGSAAIGVANELLTSRRRKLANTPEYKDALEKVKILDQTAVQEVEKLLQGTLQGFVPGLVDLSLNAGGRERFARLQDILIDDGVETSIAAKGDGVQSLATLAMTLEWTRSRSAPERQLIVAIEEPESHLHPRAIHELRRVLRELSETQQVIITTHSPSLVHRGKISSNVIVRERTAAPATSLAELRSALGVEISDSLSAADVMVCCEGQHDTEVIPAILSQIDPRLSDLMNDGRVIFDSAGGGSKVHLRAVAAKHLLAIPIIVLDGDVARDVDQILAAGDIPDTHVIRLSRAGWSHSELEDMIAPGIYKSAIEKHLGTPFSSQDFNRLTLDRSSAWSERLENILQANGFPDPKKTTRQCKAIVRDQTILAAAAGRTVHVPDSQGLFERLVSVIRASVRAE